MTAGESSAKLSPMIFLSLLFLTQIVSAAPDLGVTQGCREKAELIAHEGDKFVTVRINGENYKLTSDKIFSFQSKEPVTFRALTNDPMKGDPSLEFQMTSMVMSSLPKLIVRYSGRMETCGVYFNGTASKKQD